MSEWVLEEDNPANAILGKRVYTKDLGNGTAIQRTEYYADDALYDLNAEKAAHQAGTGWGEGKAVASMPTQLFFEKELDKAVREGDDRYISRFLNDGDFAKFRTRTGRI